MSHVLERLSKVTSYHSDSADFHQTIIEKTDALKEVVKLLTTEPFRRAIKEMTFLEKGSILESTYPHCSYLQIGELKVVTRGSPDELARLIRNDLDKADRRDKLLILVVVVIAIVYIITQAQKGLNLYKN